MQARYFIQTQSHLRQRFKTVTSLYQFMLFLKTIKLQQLNYLKVV